MDKSEYPSHNSSSLDIKWSHDFTFLSVPNFHFFGGAEFAGKVADLAWKITKITIRWKFSPENKWRSYLHSWFVLWPHWLLGWYFGPTGLRLKVSNSGAIITPWVKLRKEGVRIIGLLSTPVKWKSSYLPGGLVSWLLDFLKQPCHPELLLLHAGSHQQHLLGRRRVIWDLKWWHVKNRRQPSPDNTLHGVTLSPTPTVWSLWSLMRHP